MNREAALFTLTFIVCCLVVACGNGGPGGGRLKGDADGDGKITEADAELARKMSRGILPSLDHMDVDGDGGVTEADVEWILAHQGPASESGDATAGGQGAGGQGTETGGRAESFNRGVGVPTGGRVLKGLWETCPPAWTADSASIVMPSHNEFQLYRLHLGDGTSTPLIQSLPAGLAQQKSSSQWCNTDLARVEGTFVHAQASSSGSGSRSWRSIRVPLAGGPAEDLGDAQPDTWSQGLPKDWSPRGVSADRTLIAVTVRNPNPHPRLVTDPVRVYRLPNVHLGNITCIPDEPSFSHNVVFSPDGKLIACTVRNANPGSSDSHHLYLIRMSDLTTKTKLTEYSGYAGDSFSFSPDCRFVAIQIGWDEPQKQSMPWQEIRVIPVP